MNNHGIHTKTSDNLAIQKNFTSMRDLLVYFF